MFSLHTYRPSSVFTAVPRVNRDHDIATTLHRRRSGRLSDLRRLTCALRKIQICNQTMPIWCDGIQGKALGFKGDFGIDNDAITIIALAAAQALDMSEALAGAKRQLSGRLGALDVDDNAMRIV